jgi:hypothetical protein
VAQDMVQCSALVNTVNKFLVPQGAVPEGLSAC